VSVISLALTKKNIKSYSIYLIIIIILILLLIIIIPRLYSFKKEHFTGLTSSRDIIIIGNAPFDKNRKLGSQIDKFSQVVRFNNFKTDNFQEYIGSKTTHWCLSCFVYHSNQKLYQQRKGDLDNIRIIKPRVFKNKYPVKIALKDTAKTKLCLQGRDIIVPEKYNFGKSWPSTGVLTVFYFLQYYPKIYVTGFNHFDTSKGSIHYYENLQQIGHESNMEKTIFQDLIRDNKIEFL